MKKVSLIVPTYNGGALWRTAITAIRQQNYENLAVLVIDSGSRDGSAQSAQEAGFQVVTIPSAEFNHGGTRNRAVQMCSDSDIVVFLTQDAILNSPDAIRNMILCFDDPDIAAVCGQQLPHLDANPLAAHARAFNYPENSEVKSLADAPRLGIKTAFMSNSFAAYRVCDFCEQGGFPDHTILSEDMYMAALLLRAGKKIAYCSTANVRHSHNYSLLQEFRRYFDIGVFHADQPWIRQLFGSAGGEGRRYLISELTTSWRIGFQWAVRSLLSSGCKLAGYKLGQYYQYFPLWLIKCCSMHTRYWEK